MTDLAATILETHAPDREVREHNGCRYIVTTEVVGRLRSFWRCPNARAERDRLNARRILPTVQYEIVPGGWRWHIIAYQCKVAVS